MGSTSDIPAKPTDRERELVEWADELGAAIAPFAGEHDRDATFVTEAFELLRSSGYLALPVPQELGGRGASIRETAMGVTATAGNRMPCAITLSPTRESIICSRPSSTWLPVVLDS